MASEGALATAFQSKGQAHVTTDTVSLADGGTFDTGLTEIEEAVAESTVDNAGTTVHKASVSSTDGSGTVTIALTDIDGTAGGAAVTTAEDVKIAAVGDA